MKLKEHLLNPLMVCLKQDYPGVFELASNFTRSQSTRELYNISIKKCDVPPLKPTDGEFERAKTFTKKMFFFLQGSSVGSYSKINRAASCGRYASLFGYKTKGDVLDDPSFLEEKMKEWYVAPFSCEDKDELLSKHDVFVRKKLRTYFSSCVFFVLWMKYFYSEQNRRLKYHWSSCWSKYGYIKQYGGFADLMARLECKNFKWCSDVSGWDRVFSLLDDVCQIRRSFLTNLTESEERRLDWVEFNLINHLIILKDGSIYRKSVGNPSGSNNTTEDNTIGACIVKFYFIITLYKHFGWPIVYCDIISVWEVFLYGDDDCGGVDTLALPEKIEPEVFDSIFRDHYLETYAKFGFKVKFLYTEIGYGLPRAESEGGKLEFLGSKPEYVKGTCVPLPNLSHLCASLVTSDGDDEPYQLVAKLKAAVDLVQVLAQKRSDCMQVYKFCVEASRVILEKCELSTPDKDFLVSLSLGLYSSATLVTGYESRSAGPIFRHEVLFLPFAKEGVGNKNRMSKNKAKRDGQTIHDLQVKLHNEKMKNRLHNAQNNSQPSHSECVEAVKHLTMGIIDPDSVGGLRWPDMYSEGTSAYKSINNFFVPVKVSTSDPIGHYPDGSYYYEVHPELEESIRYLDEVDVADAHLVTGVFGISTGLTTNNWGMALPSGERLGNALPVTTSLKHYSLIIPFTSEDGTPQTPIHIPEGSTVGNAGFYYMPLGFPGASGGTSSSNPRIEMDITLSQHSVAGTATFVLTQIDINGNVLHAGATTTAGAGKSTVAINLVVSPEDLLSWTVVLSAVAATGNNLSFTVDRVSGLYYASRIMMKQEPIPDVAQVKGDVEKFRVTSQSALTTYFGSTLTNAGFATAILYRGGVPSQLASLYDYSSISEHPASYDGPLKDGTYGYWEGMDSLDYSYRTVASRELYKRPYLIMTGLYSGDPTSGAIVGTNLLRGRVITQVEFTSRSQVYDVKPSPVCPSGLVEAMRIISGVPNVMENGKHMQKLKAIASKAGKVARSLGRFAWSHREEIAQLAKAATPVMGAMLA